MIGRIHGTLLEKRAPHLLIDVQGVGYEVQVSLTTFFGLPETNNPVSLHTHFIVREDAQLLYGFSERAERHLFREIIKISGAGPKLALAILSNMTTRDFVQCVRSNDIASLIRLPGVGKKTAERLLIEMRDRVNDLGEAGYGGLPRQGAASPSNEALAEAEGALIALGYKPQEASRMVRADAPQGEQPPTSEELIRQALKRVVKKA